MQLSPKLQGKPPDNFLLGPQPPVNVVNGHRLDHDSLAHTLRDYWVNLSAIHSQLDHVHHAHVAQLAIQSKNIEANTKLQHPIKTRTKQCPELRAWSSNVSTIHAQAIATRDIRPLAFAPINVRKVCSCVVVPLTNLPSIMIQGHHMYED